jgi:hypothetical protein
MGIDLYPNVRTSIQILAETPTVFNAVYRLSDSRFFYSALSVNDAATTRHTKFLGFHDTMGLGASDDIVIKQHTQHTSADW